MNRSTSSGSSHTPSSNAASKADSSTVKSASTDLTQGEVDHASTGDGDAQSSHSVSKADTSSVKRITADLGHSKAGHSSVGDGDTLSFNSASTGDTQGITAGPAHDWSAGEIAWAVEFARKAVGSMVKGYAVDHGHSGTLKQVSTDPTQVFSSWSGRAGSDGDLAWTDGSTSDHAGKTSLTSTGTLDHVSTEHAQAVDIHQGHGLTGFEI